MNQFIFLYPIPEYINHEIENHKHITFKNNIKYKDKYKTVLNQCIHERYRTKGYKINYAVFNNSPVSHIIMIYESDRIIEVGLDFKTHTTKQRDGNYPYPDNKYILGKLGKIDKLVVAGFHMWDCVDKFAESAYKLGIDVMVDEDLTEFFSFRIKDINFRIDKYVAYVPPSHIMQDFINARLDKPWFFQNY